MRICNSKDRFYLLIRKVTKNETLCTKVKKKYLNTKKLRNKSTTTNMKTKKTTSKDMCQGQLRAKTVDSILG